MLLLKFPADIRSDFDGYNYLSHIVEVVKRTKNDEVIFDFEQVSFFQGNLCTIFGVCIEILRSNKSTFQIINLSNNVETILRKNYFLVQLGYPEIYDNITTSIRYMKFDPNDDEGFNTYIIKELLDKKDFPSVSPMLYKEILRNIFEIYENARTHGKCDFIHTCGQYFPKPGNKKLHFTLVDKGINIKENVLKHLGTEVDILSTIEWAMIWGNTTKIDKSGGLGLAVIFDFIKLNKGKIQIISADEYYEFSNEKVTTIKMDSYFDGTIVTIIFNFNDKNIYSLVNEKNDLLNPF